MRKKVVSREEIVRQGLMIIEKEGIDKCTIRHIAKSMGIGVGTIYNYFSSFDAMVLEAFQTSWEETIIKVEGVVDSNEKSVLDRVLEVIDITLGDVKKRNNLGEKLYNMYLGSSRPYFERLHKQYTLILFRIIEGIEPAEKKDAVIKWIVIVLFNHISSKVPFTEADRLLIRDLLE